MESTNVLLIRAHVVTRLDDYIPLPQGAQAKKSCSQQKQKNRCSHFQCSELKETIGKPLK